MNEMDITHPPSAEQFHRTVYAIWDFQQALSALIFLLEECDLSSKYTKAQIRRFKCYESQAIISFCRPFAQSKNGSQLSLKRIQVTLGADESRLKKDVLHLRNKIIAHSDSEEMHYKGVLIGIEDPLELKAPLLIFDEGLHLSLNQIQNLELLLRKLISAITEYTFILCKSYPELFETYKIPASRSN
ncbi:hypothetical protein PH586_03640 [Pseudomonas sp. SA3-5]|uniref:HEPN AbiU2-like domain-containing protein n=1 Tax=Pseudomonas aestuarii TaxID=3018340 RepID=A0ABT4XAS0_9PSED|nr:hypothetical protein [Pseudomonas aestuarii]MDA7085484.1 hypothetical protein [Pseudomonas aestuarii]